jgi:N-acetylmuramoyl-L-alanine amidase
MNKISVVISPSQQTGNKCVCGDSEADHMRAIAKRVFEKLYSDPRIDIYLIPSFGVVLSLEKVCTLSNAFIDQNGGRGYHIALHSDACNKKAFGASAFYYKDNSPGQKLAAALYHELSALTPWQDRSLKAYPELYELKNTKAVAALIEVSFHDESSQAKWIHDHIDSIAESIVIGIYNGINIVSPKNELIAAVNHLAAHKIINTPDYWIKNQVYNPEFVRQLIINMSKKI